mmetsp:Transcript_25206/g.38770  ORF Transcript_25206/g.38770 Transcript_25206/m.38770 type:complete len:81 (+) Transcript_25206:158-400(+)
MRSHTYLSPVCIAPQKMHGVSYEFVSLDTEGTTTNNPSYFEVSFVEASFSNGSTQFNQTTTPNGTSPTSNSEEFSLDDPH